MLRKVSRTRKRATNARPEGPAEARSEEIQARRAGLDAAPPPHSWGSLLPSTDGGVNIGWSTRARLPRLTVVILRSRESATLSSRLAHVLIFWSSPNLDFGSIGYKMAGWMERTCKGWPSRRWQRTSRGHHSETSVVTRLFFSHLHYFFDSWRTTT